MSVMEITRGDDPVRTVTVTQSGQAVDLEAAQSVRFTAKRAVEDPDEDAVLAYALNAGLTVDGNVISIQVDAADTRDESAPATWHADIEVVDAEGLTATVWRGYVHLSPDVTRDLAGS